MHDFMLDHARCNIFASPGTGKTTGSLHAFESLRLLGEAKRALVIAPKRVARSTWPDEFVKWKESFGHLTVAAAIGTSDDRLSALRSTPDVLTINYDNLPWLLEQYQHHWPFDMVFADESTRLKGLRTSIRRSIHGKEWMQGQGSSRARAIAKIAHTKVNRWVNLTGSPAPNGLQDVWGQNWFVDAGRSLGTSFDAYSRRYFRTVPGSDRKQNQIELMPYSQQEIEKLLREVSLTIDARDWFDLTEVQNNTVMIDLPPKARTQYREMQRELFTWIDEHPVEAFSSGAKSQKCLQFASGTVHAGDGLWLPVHDEKIEALESIVEELNGEAVLVAYQYREDLERILKAFPKARYLDDNPKTEKDFQQGKISMLVTHPAGAAHGLNLQHNCTNLVDYSSNFNLENDEQIIERIGPTRQMQIGSSKIVTRHRIIARDTIEETVVLPRLKSKTSLQEAFKAAMRRA